MQLPLLIRLLAYAGHLLWRLSTRCQFRVHLSRRQSIRRLLLRLGPSVSGCRWRGALRGIAGLALEDRRDLLV